MTQIKYSPLPDPDEEEPIMYSRLSMIKKYTRRVAHSTFS